MDVVEDSIWLLDEELTGEELELGVEPQVKGRGPEMGKC